MYDAGRRNSALLRTTEQRIVKVNGTLELLTKKLLGLVLCVRAMLPENAYT